MTAFAAAFGATFFRSDFFSASPDVATTFAAFACLESFAAALLVTAVFRVVAFTLLRAVVF
ncbi:MAG: hypothetical protein AAFR90_04850 [Pseudomonadota bacterium]